MNGSRGPSSKIQGSAAPTLAHAILYICKEVHMIPMIGR